jgi:hypothetical protein
VKKRLIKFTKPLFKQFGLRLVRDKDYQRLEQSNVLLTEIVHQSSQAKTSTLREGVSFIIFSKDRALQLDGLLRSILHHITGVGSIHVLYAASDQAHDRAYQEVANDLPTPCRINWKKESTFKPNLVQTLKKIETESVCFLVDDIVFIRPVNFAELSRDDIRNGILSLRLGRNITFCYTKQKQMKQPNLTPAQNNSELLCFSWDDGNYDWAYPLSVDGHIFPTTEIQTAAELLSYRAPNTFERALQILTPLYQKRAGYCLESPRILNIPLNRVQNENNNISGDISPEFLLTKWNEGMTIDFMQLSHIETQSVHEEQNISFCNRKPDPD